MDHRLLLAKSISLLYKESLLKDKVDNSNDLIRTVLEKVQVSEVGLGISSERDIINALKSTILEMCNNPIDHEYDVPDLTQRIKLNTGDDDRLFEAICDGIADNANEGALKRSIINIRRSILSFFKEQQIVDVISRASATVRFKRETIKDMNQFIAELSTQLETLTINTTTKDPAIISEVDIGDDDGLHKLFDSVKESSDGGNVYQTGWKGLNRMLQGGYRPGMNVIPALQHKYKTGMTLTLFKQLVLYNKPKTKDLNKKPLALRISFEDDLNDNIQFMYQSLRYDETREPVELGRMSSKEMQAYVTEKLQVNGFHIKMIRVIPDQWTYKSICNKVVEFESEGYSVEVLMLDYLSKVPTIGCMNTGTVGTDLCDMFSRMRNFCKAKDICCITPHQLSTEAKALLRQGLPEDQFVKMVAEKGYYERTRALDQIVDSEVFIHLFKHNKETYLAFQRGKHRIPTIVADEYKYFLLKFPKSMPIPDDREDEDQTLYKLPITSSNVSDDLFKLG